MKFDMLQSSYLSIIEPIFLRSGSDKNEDHQASDLCFTYRCSWENVMMMFTVAKSGSWWQTRRTLALRGNLWGLLLFFFCPPSQMVFSFEAGRRCDSGEGLFTFNTVQAAEIYRAVSAAIDHQKAILQETDKKAGILPSQTCVQKTEGWSWPTHMEILEGMQPPVYDIPKGNVEAGFPVALSNASNLFSSAIGNPDTSVIYASIGKSSPLLFQLWGEPEDKLQEQRGQLSDHLYENLRTLEQSSFGPESHVPSCRDSPEGSCNETSPIYDNSSAATKCSSSSPGPSLNAGTDSSPESQCQQHWLDYQRSESGGEGEALPRPKIRGTGAFKHKLVKLLSREGACKTTGKTTSPMDK